MGNRLGVAAVVALFVFMVVCVSTAFASHRCGGVIYGLPTVASKDTSCAFARRVVYVWVKDGGTREEDIGSFRHRVYSPATHRNYDVTYYLNHGSSAPVMAWANGRNSWVRFWYGN